MPLIRTDSYNYPVYINLVCLKIMCFCLEHFDSKTRVEDYMMEKAGSMIWNSVRMPAYFNNFLALAKPNKTDDGSYVLAVPMEGKPMYLMDVEDLGGCTASKI
jgi:hypothetical protein